MFKSIRQKIFIVVVAAITLVIVGMVVSNTLVLQSLGRAELIEELENASFVYAQIASQHRRIMAHEAEALAAEPAVQSSLSQPQLDQAAVADALLRGHEVSSGHAVLLLDVQGAILAARNFPGVEPGDALAMPGLGKALRRQFVYDIFSHDNHVYQIVMTSVNAADNAVGLAVVAKKLASTPGVQALLEISNLDVAVAHAGRVTGLTGALGEDLASDLQRVMSETTEPLYSFVSAHGVREFKSSPDEFFLLPMTLGDSAQLLLYSAVSARAETFQSLGWLVGVRGSLGLLAGILFSWWVAALVTRPIHSITATTREFGAGNKSARVAFASPDEFGQLAGAFNSMADAVVAEHAELLADRDAAEAASRAKSTFLATMSHEIRTPLNGLLGMSKMVSNNLKDPEQLRNMEVITRSGNNLLEIVNDILDFSKIEAGKLELATAPLNLPRFMADLCNTLAVTANEKGLELNCDLPPETAFKVLADGPRLRRILINLIGNAIKFTDTGHVDVSVQLLERQGEIAHFKFEVADTGIGIAVDRVDQIFDAFSQADDTTALKFGGTGLGLAISRQLVELMGGSLEVSSVPDRGSCFSFTLAFAVSYKETIAQAGSREAVVTASRAGEGGTAAAAPAGGTQPDYDGVRVLVVEDGDINQEVARAMLEWYGCDVEVAVNGLDALEKTAADHYDLIFMDCHMPEMDGYEATRQLRRREQSEGTDRIPVVALTANAVEGDREDCIAAGMDDYIAKPFTDDDIGRVLRKWLP